MLGLDIRAARFTWTAVCILLFVGLLYRIRAILFIFIVSVLFAYLLWPIVQPIDRRLPGRSKTPALALVYLALVGVLIAVGIALGSRVVQQANALTSRLPDLLSKFQPSAVPIISPAAEPVKVTVLTAVQQQLATHSREILGWLSNAALDVIARVGSVIYAVLVPILSFFF